MTKLEGIFPRQEPEALSSTVAAKSNYFDKTDRKNNYSWSNTVRRRGKILNAGHPPNQRHQRKKCKACTFVNKSPILITQ